MNLFYISPEQDFLSSLIEGITKKFPDIALENLTILLPSRRACNKLIDLFLVQSNKPILLPKILPIGDIEEDEIFSGKSFEDFALTIPQAFKVSEELLLLCDLLDDSSITGTIDIAKSLHKLLLRLHKDNIPISTLANLTFEDTPQHVTMVVKYLHLLGKKWLEITKQHNKLNFIERRNLQMSKLVESWLQDFPVYPVIIAGSSGSVKSTAKLLKTLASLSNGYVVLRGFSPSDDIEDRQAIDGCHPFFYLRNLINDIGIDFTQIKPWVNEQLSVDPRHKFLFEMMRTAPTVSKWHMLNTEHFKNLNNFEFIECQTSHEEAIIVALKVQETLIENKTVAVITNDTELAIKLHNIMQLWDIEVNHSHGGMLINTQQISFLKLIIEVISNFSVLNLLALLKHEFLSMGQEKLLLSETICSMELKYLRGVCNFRTLSELVNFVKEKNDWQIFNLLSDLNNFLSQFEKKSQQKNHDFQDLLHEHIKLAEKLAADDKISGINKLWSSDVGIAVSQCLNEIIIHGRTKKKVSIEEYWYLLSRLVEEKRFYHRMSSNTSVAILSSIESRLLHFDVVILSGLNEGVWPGNNAIDPWFNTNICDGLGLTSEENKIGLAALDFYCLAHSSEVLLTRSVKNDGSPTIPSRWIIRLEVLLTKLGKMQDIKPEKHKLHYWAEQLFLPAEYTIYQPPLPRPAHGFRPKEMSVTQIEKLMRDPYEFYAAKILRLKPLDLIDREPDQRDFGNFIHAVIDEFNKLFYQLEPNMYLSSLLFLAQHNIAHITNRPIVAQIWLPRFAEIAKWLVEFENIRRKSPTKKIYSEIKGKFIFDTKQGSFILTAKADRVECDHGQITIMDFKTGTLPTAIDILTGHSPQLTLEALIAEHNGFMDIASNQALIVEELIYVQLASGSRLGKLYPVKHDLSALIQATKDGIKKLVEIYLDDNTAYIICPNLERRSLYNEYEHLERIDEWI